MSSTDDSQVRVDMDKIRIDCANRLIAKVDALVCLGRAMDALDGTEQFGPDSATTMDPHPKNNKASEAYVSARAVLRMAFDSINDEAFNDIQQYAALLVRDVIAPAVRGSGDEPIVWLTSNRYYPAIRDLDKMDDIYKETSRDCGHVFQAMSNNIWMALIEQINRELDQAHILMDGPEWDNALYGVDLTRFTRIDDPDQAETMSDEWVPSATGHRQMD